MELTTKLKVAAAFIALLAQTLDASVYERIHPSIAELESALAATELSLEINQYDFDEQDNPGAMQLFAGGNSSSVVSCMKTLNHLTTAYLHEISNYSGAAIALLDDPSAALALIHDVSNADSKIRSLESQLIERFRRLIVMIMVGDYISPADPNYIAHRMKVSAEIAILRNEIGAFSSLMSNLRASLSSLVTAPQLVVEIVSLTSLDTNEEFVSLEEEAFVLVARIRNYSDQTVENVGLSLDVQSNLGTLGLEQASSELHAVGTLGPDDNIDGSGFDEALVQWSLTYSGDLLDENMRLTLVPQESGVGPSSFNANEKSIDLLVSPLLLDGDLDLLPDSWEAEYGLNPGADDSQSDGDRDGLTALQEFAVGTDPQNKDSDGDGLTDGLEIAGNGNAITDPLDPDTDDDGVNDKSDKQPLDGSSSGRGVGPGEPIVSVDVSEIVLSNDKPSATVSVKNLGEGFLTWFAQIESDLVANLDPLQGELTQGDGYLSIEPPNPDHDFSLTAGVQTTLRVFDAYGLDKDFQEVRVCHVTCNQPNISLDKVVAPKSIRTCGGPKDITLNIKNGGTEEAMGTVTLSKNGVVLQIWSDVVFGVAKNGLTSLSYSFNPLSEVEGNLDWGGKVSTINDGSLSDNTGTAQSKVVVCSN